MTALHDTDAPDWMLAWRIEHARQMAAHPAELAAIVTSGDRLVQALERCAVLVEARL